MLEAKILNEYRTVAVVGLSPDPSRLSHRVARYLAQHGYRVIPVNPHAREIQCMHKEHRRLSEELGSQLFTELSLTK